MRQFDRIVILEDDIFFGKLIQHFLTNNGFENVQYFSEEQECLASISYTENSIFLLDHDLTHSTGLQTMERIQILNDRSKFIIVSGQEYCHVAIKAIKQGAIDYIEKNKLTLYQLGTLLKKVIEFESNKDIFLKNVESEIMKQRTAFLS
jgi:two-component system, NtrC family, response regulator AtoC